ncbi:Tetracycline resistance protein, class C [Myroides odoratus]|uniref:Tetracycline resistance protein, class C n=2 Tax=Myroides odoratus TaxID=256 RepID=A0A378RM66_MYROD|nr:Tetracycline resistance protein, class C [Myroides odoratus]
MLSYFFLGYGYFILLSMTFKNKTKIVIFITITLVLDTAGFGIIFPILPDLLKELLHEDLSHAAKFAGILALAYALMQFIFAPIIGYISDQYGRRRVLLFSLLGFSLDCFFMAFASTYELLVVGRIIAGITGATFAVASAAIVDISTEDERTKYFGYLHAAFALGFILGPLMGGILGEYNLRLPFVFTGCLTLINMCFGYFYFPETNQNQGKTPFAFTIPFKQWKDMRSIENLGILLVVFFFLALASHSMESTWSFYTLGKYDWSKQQIGLSLTVIGILTFLIQTYFIQFVSKYLTDQQLITWGIVFSIGGLLLISFSSSPFISWMGMILYLIGSIQQTGFQSLLSKMVQENKQGILQGILSSINGLTTLLGPLLFTYLFYAFSKPENTFIFHGISFFVAAVFCFLALIVFKKQSR